MIPLRIYDPRILAIDLRHRRFGYAVYEGHRQLLDWGIRVYPAVGDLEAAMMRQRLAGLIKLFSPSVIVVTQERWDGRSSPHIRSLVEVILRVAAEHSVSIRAVGQTDIRQTFQNLGCETKYEVATSLARIFPQLAWKLPPPRRTWQSEHPRMTSFDAIALGLAYWQRESADIFTPD